MSEEKKATPSEELRRQFMDHSTPLNEAGHWARGRIEQLEAENKRIEDELEHTKADYLNACETIADMHCAAVGEVTGPKRGVVDDIEDLRLERDAILASKQMDFAQLVAQEDEIKLLKAENKRLREALEAVQADKEEEEQLKADREKLLQLLKSASEVIGRFVSDEGWAQSDMDTMDHIDAQIAALEAEQKPMNIDELHEQGLVSQYDMISEANNYRG